MIVNLLHHTPLWICAQAIRQCHDSIDKMDTALEVCVEDGFGGSNIELDMDYPYIDCGEKDRSLIDRVGNKLKHSSVLEQIDYNFEIQGISRAVLQELARHRIASPTVKSTRYTLRELAKEPKFIKSITYSPKSDSYRYVFTVGARQRAIKYLVQSGITRVDEQNIIKLDMLRVSVQAGVPNDRSKYELPEAYRTNLSWKINARALQNFLKLRTHPSALWEIRNLAKEIFRTIPEDHKYLFEDLIHEES